LREQEAYILPIRLDDTQIPGILPTIAYLDWSQETPETIADLLIEKLTVASRDYAAFAKRLSQETILNFIDEATSQIVFILGRFSPKRKAILDALREALRIQGYVPILFDFDKPGSQDLTETVSTLASLSRFIIVDLTDPSSAPYEVGKIASNHIRPIQAIFHSSKEERRVFAMFPDLVRRYHWVLPPYEYQNQDQLFATLKEHVIEPAEQKARELERK
jgi:hypothetical protein